MMEWEIREEPVAELAAATGRPLSVERHPRLPMEEGHVLKHQLIYGVY